MPPLASVTCSHVRGALDVSWLDACGAAAGEGCRQLPPRGDSELPEDVTQVGSDRSVREVELLTDLSVRQPLGGHARDLELLRGELIAGLRVRARLVSPEARSS